jgi:hypothetical protein
MPASRRSAPQPPPSARSTGFLIQTQPQVGPGHVQDARRARHRVDHADRSRHALVLQRGAGRASVLAPSWWRVPLLLPRIGSAATMLYGVHATVGSGERCGRGARQGRATATIAGVSNKMKCTAFRIAHTPNPHYQSALPTYVPLPHSHPPPSKSKSLSLPTHSKQGASRGLDGQ